MTDVSTTTDDKKLKVESGGRIRDFLRSIGLPAQPAPVRQPGAPTGMGGNIYEKYGVPQTREPIEARFSQQPMEPAPISERILRGSGSSAAELPGGVMTSRVAEPEPEEAAVDWLARAMALQSQYVPDYSGVAAALQDEGLAINAQIQALYNQLAAGAEQNLQAIQDVYGGAEGAVGQAYDIGTGSVGEAYQSAQQQAADQLARLGIEAAAPQVIDPMALSQAETLSGLESGRATGLSGVARSGAAATDFASQMAQVAQMQGADYQRSVADELRRQLLGLELQAQQDAYQRALQAPGLAQDLYAASQLGQPQELTAEQLMEADQIAYEREMAALERANAQTQAQQERYFQLFEFYNGDAEKASQQLELEKAAGII